jgi:hypothetical protein
MKQFDVIDTLEKVKLRLLEMKAKTKDNLKREDLKDRIRNTNQELEKAYKGQV